VCVTDVHAGVLTDGWPVVRNTSKEPVTIDHVGLAGPKGMSLVTAWAVPIEKDAYGAEPGYPPGSHALPPGFRWSQRKPAAGVAILPEASPAQTDLLFVVRLQAPVATAKGVIIDYHQGSRHWQIRTAFGLRVQASGACPG
jgi:hypothetical protein